MKTGSLWACASALFLIAASFYPTDNMWHYVALSYCFLTTIKAGIED